MNPAFEQLFSALLAQLQTVEGLKHIDIDFGQLEGYAAGYRPAVAFPCALIDFDEFSWEDLPDGGQSGEGMVVVRLGFAPFSPSGNLATASQRARALEHFVMERLIFEALHGFAGGGFGALLRRSTDTEKRNDDLRVRIIRFSTTLFDGGAVPQKARIARPQPVLHGDMVDE